MPPAITASRTPAWRKMRAMRPSWPTRTQVKASTSFSSEGSVSPRWAAAITRPPLAWTAAANRCGNLPLPAISPIGAGSAMESAGDAALGAGHELQEEIDLRVASSLGAELGQRFVQPQLGAEEDLVPLLDAGDLVLGVAMPGEAHRVQTHQLGAIALRG